MNKKEDRQPKEGKKDEIIARLVFSDAYIAKGENYDGLINRVASSIILERMLQAKTRGVDIADAYDIANKHLNPTYKIKSDNPRDKVLDTTAVECVNAFTSTFINNVVPQNYQYLTFTPSEDVIQSTFEFVRDEINKLLISTKLAGADKVTLDYYAPRTELTFEQQQKLKNDVSDKLKNIHQKYTDEFFKVLWQSNFSEEIKQFCKNLWIGTGVMFVSENKNNENIASCVSFQSLDPRYVYIELDGTKNVHGVYRDIRLKYGQIDAVFPGFDKSIIPINLSSGEKAKENELNLQEACVEIEPVEVKKTGVNGTRVVKYRWARCIFFEQKCGYIEYYEHNPYLTVFWSLSNGENLGRGKMLEVLGDILTANGILIANVYCRRQSITHKVLVSNNLDVDADLLEDPDVNVATYTNNGNTGEAPIILPKPVMPQEAWAQLEHCRERIIQASLAPKLPMKNNMREIEVRERTSEMLNAFSGELGSILSHLFWPLARIVISYMKRNLIFDNVLKRSPIVFEAGGVSLQLTSEHLSVEYDMTELTIKSLAWRTHDAAKLQEIAVTRQMIEGVGGDFNKIAKPEKIYTKVVDLMGVDKDLFKTEEEIIETIEAERAAAASAASMIEGQLQSGGAK